MKKRKLVVGSILLALIGFTTGSVYAQQQQSCDTCLPPGANGECSQPTTPPPVCEQAECPVEGCFPKIGPGECWSQCIHPGQFKTICNSVETGTSCPTPRVEQDGVITKTVNKTVREKCYGLRRPVNCKEKRVGWTYRLVTPPQTETITYTTCEEQEVPAVYDTVTDTMRVEYDEPFGKPAKESKTRVRVRVKSEWDHLFRKDSSCLNCADVCRETEEPEYDYITTYTCKGNNQQCSFGHRKQYATCSYEVERCMKPQLPPASVACETRQVEVTTAPVYEKVPVIVEVCSAGKVQKIPVDPVIDTVSCSVPDFREICTPGETTRECVAEKVQVCEPFLEWRKEQFCNYDNQGQFIRKVQMALEEEGFDPGPIDGLLGDQTRQAILSFQQQRGLAQGGTLTQETVQALGVRE